MVNLKKEEIFLMFLNVYFFLRERERERAHGVKTEKERERIPSSLCADNTET